MKNEQEKLIHFDINILQGTSITQGYNISNAFPVHFHTTYCIGVVEQGEREFFYRGEKIVIKRDEIFIVQPFEPHCCKSVNNSKHSYKIISLNLNNSIYFPHLIVPQTELLPLIREFHAVAEYDKSSLRLKILKEMIIKQLETYTIECSNEWQDIGDLSKIYIAKEFIENNCHLEISLKNMADFACLSEFHFNRLFRKKFGLSPYAYFLFCKLKLSKNILIKHKSVKEAAFDIGFYDQSHFTRLFKKHFGVTPGKYLRDNGR